MSKCYREGLISVIIPSYNHENYVQDTIQSVINQDYANIELLIVDDGSKDNTWQKIQEMKALCEERFIRINFQVQENLGICRTLNRMLNIANGEYIAIIASDDTYKPHALSTLHAFLENNSDYVLCVGNNEYIDEHGKIVFITHDGCLTENAHEAKHRSFREAFESIRKIDFTSDFFGIYQNFLLGNYIPNGYLIRNSALNDFAFTPKAPLEDYFLHLFLSKKGKYKYIDEILFSYRQLATSASRDQKKLKEMVRQTQLYEFQNTLAQNNEFSVIIKNCLSASSR